MDNTIQNILINLDKFCDYVPILSTITNAVDALVRRIFLSDETKKENLILNNRYFRHLDSKKVLGNVVLIPFVGNIAIYCYRSWEKDAQVHQSRVLARPLEIPVPGAKAYYTDEMLTSIREIVACMPRDNSDLDVSQLRPEDLVPELKNRLRRIFSNDVFVWDIYVWDRFRKALNAIDHCSNLVMIVNRENNIKSRMKEVMISDFEDLQRDILKMVLRVPLISSDDMFAYYSRTYGEQKTPKFQLDDLKFLSKIISLCNQNSDYTIVFPLFKKFRERVLDSVHNHNFRAFKREDKWAQDDYEVMCGFIKILKENFILDYQLIREFEDKLKLVLLNNGIFKQDQDFDHLFKILQHINYKQGGSQYTLDSATFRLNSSDTFVEVLAGLRLDDNQIIPCLDQFNKIMSRSHVEVRKKYQGFKNNILMGFFHKLFSSNESDTHKPKNIAKICSFCVSELADEMADLHDEKNIKDTLSSVLGTITREDGNVQELIRDDEFRRTCLESDYSYLLLPDFFKFLDICKKLFRKDKLDADDITSEQIDLSGHPEFNQLAANSICSRESVWSDKGATLIQGINHPDILGFAREYQDYKREFKKHGDADKAIIIQGQTIPYHSSLIPEYVIEELQRDESITSKGVKAIFFGFYCGFDGDSPLFKHWKSHWFPVIKKLHPEVAEEAEEPAAFFNHLYREEIDQHCSEFYQKILRDFGPPDVILKIEGKSISVHREVLKSYCKGLGHNYFSALFSGVYEQNEEIVLDLGELPPGERPSLTHRGISLQLMEIYQEKLENNACAMFREEQRGAREFFFPVTDPSILSEKTNDKFHNQLLFELRLEQFLKMKLTSNNPSEIASVLADFYVKDSRCQLRPMCDMAFRVAKEKKIRILGNEDTLMDLVQQKAYAKTRLLYNYTTEEHIHHYRYQAEHLEEEEFFTYYYRFMPEKFFPLGEKGRALFRKKALKEMKNLGYMTYNEFNNLLSALVRILSFAEIKELTTEEMSIVTDMVIVLPGKLPKLMLDSDENINLKNAVQHNWRALNQKLGTNIPFVIDFSLEVQE